MANPRILLIVGGGIAAYKACELVRLIRKGGGEVVCVLTEGGSQFVTAMALSALSGNEVHTSLWDPKNEAEIGHIQLSRSADLVVVCPATANMLAKMASGIADDLATTLLLATDKQVLAVPAMNVRMWQHEATLRNIDTLQHSGIMVMQPDVGDMACGEFGPGRLPEPVRVWFEIANILGLDPGAAGRIEALEPEEDGVGPSLGGLLGSIIQRSTPIRQFDSDGNEIEEGELYGTMLPEDPDLTHADSLLANKGRASAAPPTDREAINHEVNERQSAPEAFEGEEAAAPVNPLAPAPAQAMAKRSPGSVEVAVDTFDPLDGQPDFDSDMEHRPLYGKHVLVTAGPTHEPIDPVRYIANRSSGKQGYAIAAAAANAGARVTLISGPVNLKTPPGVDRIDIESADEMARAVKAAMPCDVAIMVAAVADWRTRDFKPDKIKKRGSAPPALILTENPDILASLAASPDRPDLLIGFAAETEEVIANARKKRKSKGVDWIVANDVSGDVMGGDANEVHLILEGKAESWDVMSKQDVATKLVAKIIERVGTNG
jgi:phosphopantothenoylcysteine decarboxylase/phosphopantothenate--cysteine ligase